MDEVDTRDVADDLVITLLEAGPAGEEAADVVDAVLPVQRGALVPPDAVHVGAGVAQSRTPSNASTTSRTRPGADASSPPRNRDSSAHRSTDASARGACRSSASCRRTS